LFWSLIFFCVDCFEAGQAYVALSRARNLKTLQVADFGPKSFRVDPNCIAYMQTVQDVPEDTRHHNHQPCGIWNMEQSRHLLETGALLFNDE
jgi:hypothetical protein